MRYLLGLREEEADRITVAPALPQALRRVGATYWVEPVPWGRYVLGIECTVRDAKGYTFRLRCMERVSEASAQAVEDEVLPESGRMQTSEWDGTWGEERILLLPQLMTLPSPNA